MASNNLFDTIKKTEDGLKMAKAAKDMPDPAISSKEAEMEKLIDELMEEAGMRSNLYNPLISDIKDKFEESRDAREYRESQWLRNVNSYRGQDSSQGRFRNSENNKTFIRTTTTKVKAAYAQIIEALFSDGTFPLQVTSTMIPDGVSEFAHLKNDYDSEPETQEEPTGPAEGLGFEGDGFSLAPGATDDQLSWLGGMKDEYSKDGETSLAEGHSKDGQTPSLPIAKKLASRMQKVILDRLEESSAKVEARKAIFEMCLLGTVVMKGPFNVNKELPKWDMDEAGNMVYAPEMKQTNKTSMVSLWNIYPDPNATCSEDMEWMIERHRMNCSQVRSLKRRPHFDHRAIERLLESGMGNWVRQSFENQLDEDNYSEAEGRLYEVLEFWGYMDRKKLEKYNLPTDQMIDDYVQVNVWISGNEVLRVVVNPFIPQRIPYYIVPYEVDPYSIWGTGVPESMEDSQAMMNGFMRLAIDNLALAGNLVFDVDDSMLIPGQDMTIEPGKIFRRQAGGAGQAIYGLTFPSTAGENLQMFDKMRQLADESTGIPSFAHGQMGVMSPTRTASGMSMLLSNASLNIKTVIRNIDDYLLKPLGEAHFRWEMQFNPDVSIKGDLEVKAMGSTALQQKEVRSQRLNTFLQLSTNPAVAPLIKMPYLIREIAISMDMDPDEILNNPDEAMAYAQIMGVMAAVQGPQQGMAPPPGMPAEQAPMPGNPGFTGNEAGAMAGGEATAAMAAAPQEGF